MGDVLGAASFVLTLDLGAVLLCSSGGTKRLSAVVASRLMISKSRLIMAAASTYEGSSCEQQ